MTDFSQTNSGELPEELITAGVELAGLTAIKLSPLEAAELIAAGNELAELLELECPKSHPRTHYALGVWETLAFKLGRRA